jgi:hypothetical protein
MPANRHELQPARPPSGCSTGMSGVPQVLLMPPEEQSLDTEPYAAAQRWLDGFMDSTVNAPVPSSLTNGSNAEAARVAGVPWEMPKPKPPAGACYAGHLPPCSLDLQCILST